MVDDDPEVLELFTRMLHACDRTLEVARAGSGEEALSELRTHRPDLVLLDLVMPAIDGWQVLEQKSSDEATRDIPVVLVTAQDILEQPLRSGELHVSTGEGVTLGQLLRLSLALPKLVVEPA